MGGAIDMKKKPFSSLSLERFEAYYPLYASYAEKETLYLKDPTLEHWKEKEEAYEIFIHALIKESKP